MSHHHAIRALGASVPLKYQAGHQAVTFRNTLPRVVPYIPTGVDFVQYRSARRNSSACRANRFDRAKSPSSNRSIQNAIQFSAAGSSEAIRLAGVHVIVPEDTLGPAHCGARLRSIEAWFNASDK